MEVSVLPELTYPNPPDIEVTLRKAKEELGLSFGYANPKVNKELTGVSMAEVGYYVTWLEYEGSENEKVTLRYVLFPFDKVMIIHTLRRYLTDGTLEESEEIRIMPAFGKCLP